MVSLPAFATTTDIYGNKTAPISVNQRYGLGRVTVRMKQRVRIIIEMKYLRARPDWSCVNGIGAEVIENSSSALAIGEFYAENT